MLLHFDTLISARRVLYDIINRCEFRIVDCSTVTRELLAANFALGPIGLALGLIGHVID